MVGVLLSALALALALFALTRKRLLWGVIGVGAHSLVLAGLYLVLAAPDVALAQAAIGFGLVTFIYLLAVRHTGKLVVAACEAYPLLYQEGERIAGLEWEMLVRFARSLHRELEVIWVPRSEIPRLLESGEADLGAGGYLPRAGEKVLLSRPLLPTRLVTVRSGAGPLGAVAGDPGEDQLPSGGRTFEDAETLRQVLERGELGGAVVDILRLRGWLLQGLKPQEASYGEETAFRIAVAPTEPEIHKALDSFLEELERTGEWKKLVERYLG